MRPLQQSSVVLKGKWIRRLSLAKIGRRLSALDVIDERDRNFACGRCSLRQHH